MTFINPQKLAEIENKLKEYGIRKEDVIERFIRSSGAGGQNVNRSAKDQSEPKKKCLEERKSNPRKSSAEESRQMRSTMGDNDCCEKALPIAKIIKIPG